MDRISLQAIEETVAEVSRAPATPKRPVTDLYHGVKVVDDYQWLEDERDAEVLRWTEDQNKYARAFLDKISAREKLLSNLREWIMATSPDYRDLDFQHRRLFALKFQPPKQQWFLVSLASADALSSEKVIVDPNDIDPEKKTSIDFYAAALNGKYVAISLSKGGSEEGSIHFYISETGEELPDVIPRVQYPTGGGSVTWNIGSTGVYYTRYPAPGERSEDELHFYQQVYYHELGTPLGEDSYVIGQEFPRIAEVKLQTSTDGRHVLAIVANGDGGEFEHHVMNPEGVWTNVTQFSDQVTQAKLGPDGFLYLLSRKNAPRGKILRLHLEHPVLANAETWVNESDVSIDGFEPGVQQLYVTTLDGGLSKIRVYDQKGDTEKSLDTEPISSVEETLRIEGDKLLFRSETFITPPAWYLYDPLTKTMTKTKLVVESPASFDDCEVIREYAKSKDGTMVPVNIIRRKGVQLNGQNPTLLTGYGGYGISLKPYFRIRRRAWLDAGGVYVVANLRGGGEYGEEWHKAGYLTKKQNVFDDFVASAKHLIDRRCTRPGKLAIEGGSNGGLLVAAVMTQHPELFRAVAAYVGVFDSLRSELEPNGEFNVTEFGTVKDLDQFRALYAYSPYHHVTDGTKYPAILLTTGWNDHRVSPSNSRKMAARLQAANQGDEPVLLRTTFDTGHGMGTTLDEQIREAADVFAFLFDRLGMT
ncbi:MAG TPA: prolyl oligopeptidase family serine peptidase [Candidatus Bathyarchaeia archaeon]|nr:prolyl oligopeptidase family serine peptidase [Candidatus Bathyarchaeia archaeon]